LREIEVLLIAGESVKKDHDRVLPGSRCDVGESVEHGALAGDLKGLDCGWVCLVRGRVSGDGRRKLLRVQRDTKKRGCSEEKR
jgi:hypothetical protein